MGLLLGYDLGSSAIKASLLDAQTGTHVASAASPFDHEMEIHAPHPGWAEQDPETWWEHAIAATLMLKAKPGVNLSDVEAIGISYQMHGLVVVDSNRAVLRPSVIWCDSRAVEIGEKAADEIGRERCLESFLNFPGNFTASKLAWVKNYEPDIFSHVWKFMLPGDYLAMKLTGDVRSTVSGLSEGILWNFREDKIAWQILDTFGIPADLIADTVPTFGNQGNVSKEAARVLGIREGVPVSYRAGDQPNNALSLNVLNPGEIAATAGTSGVVYGVSDKPVYDPKSRVNTFLHVNHNPDTNRYGVLLCVNGTGILNSWLRNEILGGFGKSITYDEMNALASETPIGASGLVFLPYGNGSERTLENRDIASSLHGLNFNIHGLGHVLRAAQEGIVFALNYGIEVMREMGLDIHTVRAGHANMFLSPVFREAFANTSGTVLELYRTDGAQGAARGAGIGSGIFSDFSEAFKGLEVIETIEPDENLVGKYNEAWHRWLGIFREQLE